MLTWLNRRKFKSDFENALEKIWFSTADPLHNNTNQALVKNITADPDIPKLLEELRTKDVTPVEAAITVAQVQVRTLYSGPTSIFTDEQRDEIREIVLNNAPPTAEERPDTRPFFLFMLEHALYTISDWMMHGDINTPYFKEFLDTAVETFTDSLEEQGLIQDYLLNGSYAYRDWVADSLND